MRIEQSDSKLGARWTAPADGLGAGAQLAWVFGGTERLADPSVHEALRDAYPNAHLVYASTAGEIRGTNVFDDSVVVTAMAFDHTRVCTATVQIADSGNSRAAARTLAGAFDTNGLRHVVVLSDGLRVNGSELAVGLREALPAHVAVTGGLSGDSDRFQRTLVGLDAAPAEGNLVAVGFYGDRLRIGFGSLGGWDPFGPDRIITRSRGNVLYELDGCSALDLYRSYLGEHAKGLPATGLLFPLSLREREDAPAVVRTILAVDEQAQSLTFAGDVPEGFIARLMRANFDRLIDGAIGAAHGSYQALSGASPDLALLISCVGRKLVLKQRVEEEVEGVRDVLGPRAVLMGFYSYGEICPHSASVRCELHNQTMTITTFTEA